MISWGSIVVVLLLAFCWQHLKTMYRQAVVFSWSTCIPAPAQLLCFSFNGWFMLHCWGLCLVLFFLLVAYVLCLRNSHHDQWQFISFSMLLSSSCFSLLHGCVCGLVPGGAELNGVAPSSGEQPVPSAPRCRPSWPSRSMMIQNYPETFFVLSLCSLLKVYGCLMASRYFDCRYSSLYFKCVAVCLSMSFILLYLYVVPVSYTHLTLPTNREV